MKSIPSNRIAKIAIRFAIFKNFFWLRFDSNRLPDPSNRIAIFKSIICLEKIDWNRDFRFDFTLILVIFDLKIVIPIDFFQQIDLASRFQIDFCGKFRFWFRFFVILISRFGIRFLTFQKFDLMIRLKSILIDLIIGLLIYVQVYSSLKQ